MDHSLVVAARWSLVVIQYHTLDCLLVSPGILEDRFWGLLFMVSAWPDRHKSITIQKHFFCGVLLLTEKFHHHWKPLSLVVSVVSEDWKHRQCDLKQQKSSCCYTCNREWCFCFLSLLRGSVLGEIRCLLCEDIIIMLHLTYNDM